MQTSLFRKPFSKDLFKTKPITKQSVINDLLDEVTNLKNSYKTLKGNFTKLKNKQK